MVFQEVSIPTTSTTITKKGGDADADANCFSPDSKAQLRNPHPDPNIILASKETRALPLLNSLGTGRLAYISREKGRGIVATRTLPAGTLIERAPLLYLTAKDAAKCEETRLYSYFFGVGPEESGLALGFGSLYNHGTADASNMSYQIVQEETPTPAPETAADTAAADDEQKPEKFEDSSYPDYNLFVEFWTKRDVVAGEELLIDYQQRFGDQYPLWFPYKKDGKEEEDTTAN